MKNIISLSLIFFIATTGGITFVSGQEVIELDDLDSDMKECVLFLKDHLPLEEGLGEYAVTGQKTFCDFAYDNYGKYFHEMNTEELNESSAQLLQIMKDIFK